MSQIQTLRGFINQRLTSAAEEIFALFERTILKYEEQLSRSKEENERQKKLLDTVYNPEVRLHRADVQQLSGMKEEDPPEPLQRSPSLDQELPPELPHIKEEQEELWSSRGGEQLHGLEEEDDVSPLVFTPVPVKSEEEEGEEAQSSQHRESQTEESGESFKTEADGEDCGGPEPESPALQRAPERDSGDSSHVSNPLGNDRVDLREMQVDAAPTSFSPLAYALSFGRLEQLQQREALMEIEEKPFSCSVCGKRFSKKRYLQKHTIRHTDERRFSCSVCGKTFLWRVEVVRHMKTHTKEKPFTCHICGLFFQTGSMLAYHLKHHMEADPFTCSVCGSGFSHREAWEKHMEGHNRDPAPLTCLTCGKTFSKRGNLNKHLRVHTGEKPYCCGLCEKRFTWSSSFKRHSCGTSSQET